MAVIQSRVAQGIDQVPDSYHYGVNASYLAVLDLPAGKNIAAGDVVEIGILPPDHRFVTAQVIPEGAFGAGVTADIGLMSGTVGSQDPARTVGDELFDGVALTAFASLTSGEALLVAPSPVARSIGVKFSAAVTGAGQKLTMQIVIANTNA